jgi:glycosyltransferase involved in cell wall biosynthesis
MLSRPKRVLHVIRAMGMAGTETWLMRALRRLDARRVRMDFLVHTAERWAYDEEIEALGSRIFRICTPLRSPAYATAVMRLLRQRSFDAVHSHVHHFSGYLLPLAKAACDALRIAHSHTDTSRADLAANPLRRCYLHLMKRSIRSYADRMVGVSGPAGESLFGANWLNDPRSRVLFCGVDPAPFLRLPGRAEARAEWGVGEDELVIGHVGRFEKPKNHLFLLDVAAEIARSRTNLRVLLVGDGGLVESIRERSRTLGIERNIIFAGAREDVPRMLAAMDVFLFPSHHEGLGLSLVEAQAAGLPCVISDVIPDEADINPGLIHRLALSSGPGIWAETVLRAPNGVLPDRRECFGTLENSRLNIERSVEGLYALYEA